MNIELMNKLVKKASIAANRAIDLDKKRDLEGAFDNYVEAAELLLRLIKLTDRPDQKRSWERRANEYIARANHLKPPEKRGQGRKRSRRTLLRRIGLYRRSFPGKFGNPSGRTSPKHLSARNGRRPIGRGICGDYGD